MDKVQYSIQKDLTCAYVFAIMGVDQQGKQISTLQTRALNNTGLYLIRLFNSQTLK